MEQVAEEQQQQHPLLLRTDTDSASPYSMNHPVAASLSLPFTLLNSAADHRIFIGDSYNDDPPLGDCGYTTSRPFVVLDVIWNFAFVLVSFFVLLTTIKEKPSTPLRLWIAGYALQCLLHVGFVYLDLQIRNQADLGVAVADGLLSTLGHNCIIKKLESMSTVVSSVWWVFGFYWIVVGGQALIQDSPRLYWLAVVFLAFDVFFMIFCIAMACIVFFAVFCCVPVLATIAYAMTIREGASENDIRTLPKYKYCQAKPSGTFETDKNQEVASLVDSGSSSSTPALTLHPEDSDCCICLYRYVDGAELCTLPCNHHFHHGCISKWLRINATCPLCKFNILKGEMMV